MTKVTRRSILTGIERTLEIDVDAALLSKYEKGETDLIQKTFPHLSADLREFIMTGITSEEWEEHVRSDE